MMDAARGADDALSPGALLLAQLVPGLPIAGMQRSQNRVGAIGVPPGPPASAAAVPPLPAPAPLPPPALLPFGVLFDVSFAACPAKRLGCSFRRNEHFRGFEVHAFERVGALWSVLRAPSSCVALRKCGLRVRRCRLAVPRRRWRRGCL